MCRKRGIKVLAWTLDKIKMPCILKIEQARLLGALVTPRSHGPVCSQAMGKHLGPATTVVMAGAASDGVAQRVCKWWGCPVGFWQYQWCWDPCNYPSTHGDFSCGRQGLEHPSLITLPGVSSIPCGGKQWEGCRDLRGWLPTTMGRRKPKLMSHILFWDHHSSRFHVKTVSSGLGSEEQNCRAWRAQGPTLCDTAGMESWQPGGTSHLAPTNSGHG